MIKHDFTIDIQAPIARVFDYTTDFRNFVQWQDGVSAATQTPEGPTRAGTTFSLKRTFLGKSMEAAGVVTDLVQNERCAFKTTAGPIQLSVTQTYEAIADGTRVNLHLEAEPGGFFKLAEGAIDRQIQAAFDTQVQKLKAVLEK